MVAHFPKRRWMRTGTMMVEILVACSLIGTALLILGPTFIRLQRAHCFLQHDQIALEELTSHLQELCLLDRESIQLALESRELSRVVKERLSGPVFSGRLNEVGPAVHITLTLAWNDPGRRERPMSLATWIYPQPKATE